MSESALDRERRDHAKTKDEKQRHILELQRRIELESQFRTTQWNELLADFPTLKELVRVLLHVRLAAGPLRGAPSEDTMRVGHTELTSVEAAADWPAAKHSKRDRSRVQWANKQITALANRLDDDVAGSENKRPSVEKPRCRRRDCSEPDKRQPFGAKYCAFCARPMGEAA